MYVLKQQNTEIRVTDIATKMNCSKASVTKSLNSLKEKGLVNYEAYGKIELTEEAEEIAQKLLEAYDIVYLFLNDILEVSNSKEEAEKIKSVMSDDAINKLARYIHKELKLSSLDCKYDINESKCRSCIKRKGEKIC